MVITVNINNAPVREAKTWLWTRGQHSATDEELGCCRLSTARVLHGKLARGGEKKINKKTLL